MYQSKERSGSHLFQHREKYQIRFSLFRIEFCHSCLVHTKVRSQETPPRVLLHYQTLPRFSIIIPEKIVLVVQSRTVLY